jgi:hypothetical protein
MAPTLPGFLERVKIVGRETIPLDLGSSELVRVERRLGSLDVLS